MRSYLVADSIPILASHKVPLDLPVKSAPSFFAIKTQSADNTKRGSNHLINHVNRQILIKVGSLMVLFHWSGF